MAAASCGDAMHAFLSSCRHDTSACTPTCPLPCRLGVGARRPLLVQVALCMNALTQQPVDCPTASLDSVTGAAANACREGFGNGPLAFMPGTMVRPASIGRYDCSFRSHRAVHSKVCGVKKPWCVCKAAEPASIVLV